MRESFQPLRRLILAAAIVPIAAIPCIIWREEFPALNVLFFASPLVAGFIVGRDRTDGVCRRGALAGALGMAFTIATATLASQAELEGAAVVISAGFVLFAGVTGAVGAFLAFHQPRYGD